MVKKDFVRVKDWIFKVRTKLEIEYALGYEEALNNFGMLTRNQHYTLFDHIWAKKHNYHIILKEVISCKLQK